VAAEIRADNDGSEIFSICHKKKVGPDCIYFDRFFPYPGRIDFVIQVGGISDV